MGCKYQKSLFIFRRDLRLEDNTGLIYALENSKIVIPCFIFTPEQIKQNPYRSDSCLQFMIESLVDLDEQLKTKGGKLYLFYDKIENILEQCIKKLHIDCIIVNRDYTPFSQERDEKIAEICKRHRIEFQIFEDILLNPPENTLKENGEPYKIFTPYYRHVTSFEVAKPRTNDWNNYLNEPMNFSKTSEVYQSVLSKRLPNLAVQGGRKAGEKILKTLGDFSRYSIERDFPALHGTTKLSAYLKFTIFSPREIYYAILENLGKHHELIRALYWRDFFSTVAFFFPHVFKGSFYKKFDVLKWSDDKQVFKKWCQGETGFPIIDAGMRELNITGFMHNRVRMIVASFLTKDLHLNWQWGEKYFAQKLIDYDPAVNNGNWQWSASTGCDSQPYFRIFNPWLQQKKFDPDCNYIKQWIPELKQIPPKVIHKWYDEGMHKLCRDYPPPIVVHDIESKVSLKLYQSIH